MSLAQIFPFLKSYRYQHALKQFAKHADDLQKLFFVIFINQDYPEHRFKYEKKIHAQLVKLLQAKMVLEKWNKNSGYNLFIEKILSMGSLRYRIQDHATFEVCQKELKAISEKMSASIYQPNQINLVELKQAIKSFKKIYRNTLTVVSKEPIYFLVFIEQLLEIYDSLKEKLTMTLRFTKNDSDSRSSQNQEALTTNFKSHNRVKTLKKGLKYTIVLTLALVISYYYSHAEKIWLVLSSFLVMQTRVNLTLRGGILIYIGLVLTVLLGSSVLHEITMMQARLYDVTIGAFVGILGNLILFPTRIDEHFRYHLGVLLKWDLIYFENMINVFLKKQSPDKLSAYSSSIQKILISDDFPIWLYETGFNDRLQLGYSHFLMMTERLTQILLSMDYLVQHHFPTNNNLETSLQEWMESVKEIMNAMITLFHLQKVVEPLSDLQMELSAVEKEVKTLIPNELSLKDLKKQTLWLASFVLCLRDIRLVMIKLGQSLRK